MAVRRPSVVTLGHVLNPRESARAPTLSESPDCAAVQWTGIVTSIAIEMLESGRVDAVVCVQNDENDRFTPKPVRRPKDVTAPKVRSNQLDQTRAQIPAAASLEGFTPCDFC